MTVTLKQEQGRVLCGYLDYFCLEEATLVGCLTYEEISDAVTKMIGSSLSYKCWCTQDIVETHRMLRKLRSLSRMVKSCTKNSYSPNYAALLHSEQYKYSTACSASKESQLHHLCRALLNCRVLQPQWGLSDALHTYIIIIQSCLKEEAKLS